MNKIKIALLTVALSSSVCAEDLGVFGRVWDIQEVDLRQMLAEQLARVNQAAVQSELEISAKNYVKTIPADHLPRATATRTRWVDPSIELTQAVHAPVEQPDGTLAWEIMIPAGTRVNPLTEVRPTENMLFFNAKDPEQVDFALAALKARPRDLMLVATDGDVGQLSEQIQVPVYHSNPSIIERFEIKATPSLLGVGTGFRELYLAVTEFESPYDPRLIDKAWHGLPEAAEPVP